MDKIREFIKNHSSEFLITLVVIVVFYLNIKPGTYLSGWDNLHPEFNISNDINRSLFATWQEYRSFGLLGGMAHAADLPRQIIISLISSFVQTNNIRYLWVFVTYLLAGLGSSLLIKNTLISRFDTKTKNIGGFFGALFYITNLAAVQVYFTSFETFTSFYGFLPILLLSIILYLKSPNRKNLLYIYLAHIFASPSFYVQTVFFVYLIVILLLLTTQIIKYPTKLKLIQGIIIIFTITCTSFYYLASPILYTLKSVDTTSSSLQNQIATREVIARNQEFGDIKNALILKGYWFGYVDPDKNNQFNYLMNPYIQHLQNPTISIIAYLLFFFILLGFVFSHIRKLSYRWFYTSILLISLFFIVNLNPPSEYLFQMLQRNIPVLKEFMRSPFTKWSPVLSLIFSAYLSLFTVLLIDLFTTISQRVAYILTSFSLTVFILLLSAPIFQGQLIYDSLKINFPDDYFQTRDFLEKQEPGRILVLPQHTFWGWQYYDFGYRGSGFIWYFLKNPIIDRAFDVWSRYSQDAYLTLRHSIYSENIIENKTLLNLYDIKYILLDDHLIIPGTSSKDGFAYDSINKLLTHNDDLKKVATFGKITIYENNLSTKPIDYIDTKKYKQNEIPTEKPDKNNPTIVITPKSNRSSLSDKKNCDNFNSTFFDRVISNDSVSYKSIGASSCDHFLLPEIPHSTAYELKITHKNISGEPFFVCLESYTTHQCEIYQYLDSHPDWKTQTLYIPNLKPGEFGYTLNLFNYSIGRNPTQNSWSKIELIPAEKQYVVPSNNIPNSEYASIKNVVRHSPVLYNVDLNPQSVNTHITLNQAYDEGWVLLKPQETFSYLPDMLEALISPPLENTNHIKTKTWANTWTLPSGTSRVIIFYYPHILQIFGFVILPLPILLFFLHKSKKAPVEGR